MAAKCHCPRSANEMHDDDVVISYLQLNRVEAYSLTLSNFDILQRPPDVLNTVVGAPAPVGLPQIPENGPFGPLIHPHVSPIGSCERDSYQVGRFGRVVWDGFPLGILDSLIIAFQDDLFIEIQIVWCGCHGRGGAGSHRRRGRRGRRRSAGGGGEQQPHEHRKYELFFHRGSPNLSRTNP